MSQLIGMSNFAKRHTKDSSYSYFDGTNEELIKLVTHYYNNGDIEKGYKDGVVLVTVPSNKFYSSIVKIDKNSQLTSKMTQRQPNEDFILETHVRNARKSKAQHVQIVLYRDDVLDEDNDRSTSAKWEIISINASPYTKDIKIPMHPITMMRNELHLPGGTRANYNKFEYLEAIKFWSNHATVE